MKTARAGILVVAISLVGVVLATRARPALGAGGAPPVVASAHASSAASASGSSASSSAASSTAAPGTTAVPDDSAARVRALLDRRLSVACDPQSLFDVALDDEAAVQIERVRLRALLERLDGLATQASSASRKGPLLASASASRALPALSAEIARVDAAGWRERVALDRARLAFLERSPAERAALLAEHAAQKAAAEPQESEEARRDRLAEAERARALRAANEARSEAERLVAEELARLIGLEQKVAKVRESFADERVALTARKDAVLGAQRRARDAKNAGTEAADREYDALRAALRASRDAVSTALHANAVETSAVPAIGGDPLIDVPADVPTEAARDRRLAVVAQIALARTEERASRHIRAAALLEEITLLNRERLGLLPYLSAPKRDAVTGFASTGREQAVAEARHLGLVLRYHQQTGLRWLQDVRSGGDTGVSGWTLAAVLVPWSMLALAFVWVRRRSAHALGLLVSRFEEDDRAERLTKPSVATRVARFAAKVHRPLESLLFATGTFWLLPEAARTLLETQLLAVVVAWSLGSALVVAILDAVAASSDALHPHATLPDGELRRRSLRLVGRVVTVFASVLVLTSRLVGQGTVYGWVLSTCWLSALPVFLVVVRWWRPTIFERVAKVRKRNALEAWVLARREGWSSPLAATVGAVHLFAVGTVKIVRDRLEAINLARRAHAYLYKRELARLATGAEGSRHEPLSGEALSTLAPDAVHRAWIATRNDARTKKIHERLDAERGGSVAVIGRMGMGKSALLRQLAKDRPDAVLVPCTRETTARDLALAVPPTAKLVLVDDAQRLVRPVIGGLRTFDDVMAHVREARRDVLWVFAFDALLWPLLSRAREAPPAFDESVHLGAWTEEEIGALIDDRDGQADLSPTFADLLEPLPASADEIDRLDALAESKEGYVRMLWDNVRGNPGLALEAWRSSLVRAEDGSVHVRPLQVPDDAALVGLPHTALFVFRAVLQLSPAEPAMLAAVTHLTPGEVESVLRFGEREGYFVCGPEGVRVSWRWLDAIERVLERRHLVGAV